MNLNVNTWNVTSFDRYTYQERKAQINKETACARDFEDICELAEVITLSVIKEALKDSDWSETDVKQKLAEVNVNGVALDAKVYEPVEQGDGSYKFVMFYDPAGEYFLSVPFMIAGTVSLLRGKICTFLISNLVFTVTNDNELIECSDFELHDFYCRNPGMFDLQAFCGSVVGLCGENKDK